MSAPISQTARVLGVFGHGDRLAALAECRRLEAARLPGQMFWLNGTVDGRWQLVEDWLPEYGPASPAFQRGARARKDRNPYGQGTILGVAWRNGWATARARVR